MAADRPAGASEADGGARPDIDALAHRAVEWIAAYRRSLETRPVWSDVRPGTVLDALPGAPPVHPADADEWDRVFADLDTLIAPNLLHWQSPRFFGFFPCNHSGPAIVAEIVSAGLNVNAMNWATSPAATELETRVLDWIGRLIGLPETFLSVSEHGGGCIQGTASEATLVALVAGRERLRRRDPHAADHPARMVVYASPEAHSSVVKAAMIAGIARGPDDAERVRAIAVDDRFRMSPSAIADALRADLAAGREPVCVVGTVGTTGVTAVDPIGPIAEALDRVHVEARARPCEAWLHVDAAHAGAMCVCPEHQHVLAGVDRWDSVCFNPHKWLLTNFDCDLFWTRDRRGLTGSLSVTPEYLRNVASDSGAVIDYRDWGIPLGRRMRALKLWFVLRHYGVEGLRAHVRRHLDMAAWLEARVRDDARLELVAPRTMNLVCLADRRGDEATRTLLDTVNRRGRVFVSHGAVPSPGGGRRLAIRVAIGSTLTERRHVEEAWGELVAALA